MLMKTSALVLALCVAAPALAETQPQPPATDAHIEALVKRYIEQHPDVLFNAVNDYVAKIRQKKEDEKSRAVLLSSQEIMQADGLPFVGNPVGRTTMVYFLDAACGYCRSDASAIEELVSRRPDVKVVLRFLPFLTTASEYAARVAGVVVSRYPTKYPQFQHALMSKPDKLTRELVDGVVVAALGADALEGVQQAASEDAKFARQVRDNDALARRIGVQATPFFFVPNIGEAGLLRGLATVDELTSAVDAASKAEKK